jgi:hypothetical protein
MQKFDINLAMDDNNGQYNITLGDEIIYSVSQNEGLDGINSVFDALERTIEVVTQSIAKHSENDNITVSRTK